MVKPRFHLVLSPMLHGQTRIKVQLVRENGDYGTVGNIAIKAETAPDIVRAFTLVFPTTTSGRAVHDPRIESP